LAPFPTFNHFYKTFSFPKVNCHSWWSLIDVTFDFSNRWDLKFSVNVKLHNWPMTSGENNFCVVLLIDTFSTLSSTQNLTFPSILKVTFHCQWKSLEVSNADKELNLNKTKIIRIFFLRVFKMIHCHGNQ